MFATTKDIADAIFAFIWIAGLMGYAIAQIFVDDNEPFSWHAPFPVFGIYAPVIAVVYLFIRSRL